MYAIYGSKKCGEMPVAMSPCGCAIVTPPEPDKVSDDRSPRCRGCPYPRHGLFCRTDSESCLRTDMREIERKSRRRLEAAPI